MMTIKPKSKIGLVLGGGSARGWAHIGVIRALEQIGVKPDMVCGTSIGALVGAIYAAGELDRFEEWVLGLGMSEIFSYMDVSFSSGLLKGERLMEFFRTDFIDRPIHELSMPFAAVATSLNSGAEVWLRTGSTLDAVRASIALPGLFTPVLHDGVVLVDGGLVNPVPVSLARAMGADIVIAVDLNADRVGQRIKANLEENERSPHVEAASWAEKLKENLGAYMPTISSEKTKLPSMLDVLASSINVMQVRITRSRMAGEPPDLIITPKLSHVGMLEFHLAKETIEEGKRAVESVAQNFLVNN